MSSKVAPIQPEPVSDAVQMLRDGSPIVGVMWAAFIELTFAALALVGYLAWRLF